MLFVLFDTLYFQNSLAVGQDGFGDMMIKKILSLLSLHILVVGFDAAAQTPDGGGTGSPYEVGIHTGFLLPNHIDGVTEIMAVTGFRGAILMPGDFYTEAGFMAGNGDGQKWKTFHLDARLDFPVETLVAMAYVGVDMHYYSGPGISNTIAFGGHVGGGFKAAIGRNVAFRTDMKFNGQPGTSLFFGFGIDVGF